MTGLRHPAKLAKQAAWHRLHGRADAAERIEAALVAGGRCRICGRAIRDEVSLARGVGPDCWAAIEKEGTVTDRFRRAMNTRDSIRRELDAGQPAGEIVHRTVAQRGGWLVCACGAKEATVWGMAVHRKQQAGEMPNEEHLASKEQP